MSASNINDTEFDSSVIKAKKAAIVFFWAAWDGGSKASMPTFDQSADENPNKLAFYKLDVDANTATPAKLGVRAVPTVILFKDGQANNQFVGALTRTKLNDLISKA